MYFAVKIIKSDNFYYCKQCIILLFDETTIGRLFPFSHVQISFAYI